MHVRACVISWPLLFKPTGSRRVPFAEVRKRVQEGKLQGGFRQVQNQGSHLSYFRPLCHFGRSCLSRSSLWSWQYKGQMTVCGCLDCQLRLGTDVACWYFERSWVVKCQSAQTLFPPCLIARTLEDFLRWTRDTFSVLNGLARKLQLAWIWQQEQAVQQLLPVWAVQRCTDLSLSVVLLLRGRRLGKLSISVRS